MGKNLYDPKYGICPDKIEDFSKEHRASIEDILMTFRAQPDNNIEAKVVALINM